MLFLPIITFSLKCCISSEWEPNWNSNNKTYSGLLNIDCADKITVSLEHEVWSKYEYLQNKITNLLENDCKTKSINEDFDSEVLINIRDITKNIKKSPIKIRHLKEILRAIGKFSIMKDYESSLYKNIFINGINSEEIEEILNLYIDYLNDYGNYFYKNPNFTL
ncbi:hypothetical protein DMUE_2598 [Dictyocoela muelleri]|nr:hypothetical protein DMUE_2598 [Dictyocoela muelleri]